MELQLQNVSAIEERTVQERYEEGPLQRNDIAAEVIESRFVERNKKSKEDTCIENLDQDINVETESESNDDEYDSDLDPTFPVADEIRIERSAFEKILARTLSLDELIMYEE
ncbi:general transcription factor IIH subunit 1-like protein [Corchorus olitorius]|uniref:General transcription factor IIH subunit 1-like protein n=1 Tax=Corchorus olitorius TaxID=93759 RepID=A0A1R3HM44_9ROSI|nr:general transcription factor IIH subunit 1-like protein [Corchorus olitorius]